MKTKKILGITALYLGSLIVASNSFAQTALDRSGWSLSSNRNAADSFSAIDGNANSRWTTRERQRDGQYFQVDFNRTHTINRVVLDTSRSANDYPREYELQVSTNGGRFTTIASGTPSASGVTTINFSPRSASSIRIEQNGSDNRFWWSIHELNVFSGDDNDNSGDFERCATEGGTCSIPGSGTVRYGANGRYNQQFFSSARNVQCTNAQFGDPIPGTRKTCEFQSDGNDNGGGGNLPDGVHPDITRIADIAPEEILRNPGGEGWKDSYSVGDRCYCDTTFDHDIGGIRVDTPIGNITVRDACNRLGSGPGSRGRPIYNDVQCGNGPANNAGDEDYCPGRTDIGKEGCTHIGPKWNFN